MSLGYKKYEKLSEKCEIRHASISKNESTVYYIDPSCTNNEKDDAIKMIDNLKKRKKRLVIFLIIVILSLLSIILFGTLCSDDVCALSISLNRKKLFSEHHLNTNNNNINHHENNISSSSLNNKNSHLLLSYDDVLNDDFQNKFDINSNDVMVILCNVISNSSITIHSRFCFFFACCISLLIIGISAHTKSNNLYSFL
jgi:predicted PurR-regulated permease PerM